MRLSDVVNTCNKPFKWGENDCCTLMGAVVQAVQGRDIVSAFLGYSDKSGAAKALRENGNGTLLATLTTLLGDPVNVASARPGDIVMLDDWRVGVCMGRYSVFIGDNGLESVRTMACQRAFLNRADHG